MAAADEFIKRTQFAYIILFSGSAERIIISPIAITIKIEKK